MNSNKSLDYMITSQFFHKHVELSSGSHDVRVCYFLNM